MRRLIPEMGGVCLFLSFIPLASAVDVKFSGTLIDHPCEIDQNTFPSVIEFPTIPLKNFQYAPGRGGTRHFTIRLINCDTESVWKKVALTFSGDKPLPSRIKGNNFIKFSKDGGDETDALVIGLVGGDGVTPVKVYESREVSPPDDEFSEIKQQVEKDGTTIIVSFGAYMQAIPEAILGESVQTGEYSATAFLNVFYK